jgi:hypothetical protein
MEVTAGPNIGSDGNQWWTMEFNNWNGPGTSLSMTIRATDTDVYINESPNPHFEIGDIDHTWTDEDGRLCGIQAITSYGGFDNVYVMVQGWNETNPDYQSFQYWKPGVGLLYEYTPNYLGLGSAETRTLTSSAATPVPPSLLLLGSGLIGLLGLRRFGRS